MNPIFIICHICKKELDSPIGTVPDGQGNMIAVHQHCVPQSPDLTQGDQKKAEAKA